MADDPNLFRIMLATDTHVGYKERDPVRGNDSFVTFEEILQHAQRENVDFLLHGGDMFHDNKPSRSTLYRTMQLLRKYCLGERAISFTVVSDQSINFHTNGVVNYEDENFNISLPVFAIHGNHDDPAGDGSLCSLDLLSMANLVNYFGKSPSIDDITLFPILLVKGTTKIAIYGLGNIRDERLYQTFKDRKVKLMRPREARDEWFNIFVIHQNRVAHSEKNYIHEVMLDNFLDLIIWGHEHECRLKPEESSIGFQIIQPGSSVATSFCDGEAGPKKVGVLEVRGDQWRVLDIPLCTVRPFIMDSIVLESEFERQSKEGAIRGSITDTDTVSELLSRKVEEMISSVPRVWPYNAPNRPSKPLIRLRVESATGMTINPARFGQQFVESVANPTDILLFQRKKRTGAPGRKRARSTRNANGEGDEDDEDELGDEEDSLDVSTAIRSFLSSGSRNELSILPEYDLNIALQSYVDKGDNSAISDLVDKILRDTQTYLKRHTTPDVTPQDMTTMIKDRLATLVPAEEMDVVVPSTAATATATSESMSSSSSSSSTSTATSTSTSTSTSPRSRSRSSKSAAPTAPTPAPTAPLPTIKKEPQAPAAATRVDHRHHDRDEDEMPTLIAGASVPKSRTGGQLSPTRARYAASSTTKTTAASTSTSTATATSTSATTVTMTTTTVSATTAASVVRPTIKLEVICDDVEMSSPKKPAAAPPARQRKRPASVLDEESSTRPSSSSSSASSTASTTNSTTASKAKRLKSSQSSNSSNPFSKWVTPASTTESESTITQSQQAQIHIEYQPAAAATSSWGKRKAPPPPPSNDR